MLLMACVLLLAAVASSVQAEFDTLPCQPDKLTVYRVVLHTFWTRDLFPKHYPDWRPPAQWSKLIGRSHDLSYTLFRLGHTASPGVKAFVETGRSDDLEAENQGEGGVFDIFSAPAISTGAGRAEAEFFVDGNHSRVSLMSRITPSPDWFIGLDSFNLCVNGNWLDSITIEVDPLDGGTDNGFTFTAPNWVTEPQGVVYRITSRYPSHPAGSFYYPYLKRLPPIATFQFIKAREYELNEVFHHTEDDKRYDLLKLDQQNTISVINNDHNNDIQLEMEAERKEQEMRLQQQLATRKILQRTRQKYNRIKKNKMRAYQKRFRKYYSRKKTRTAKHRTIRKYVRLPVGSNSSQPPTPHALAPGVIPRGDTDAILNSIVETYHNKELLHKSKKAARKFRGLRDCRVGEWGIWSPCSMSCGVGEMTRKREVVKHARHGGKPCPPLVETKWCGSAQDCSHRPYFNW